MIGAAVRPYFVAGALLIILGIPIAIYMKGRADGAAVAESKAIQSTFDQLKERGLINEAVRNSDDCELLADLGVVCDQ